MKDKARKVYFSKVQVRKMMTHEPETDRQIIKAEVFDRFVNAYNAAVESGDYSSFQIKIEDEIIMVSNLHYIDSCICGIIGRGSPKINRFLCERNPSTFGTKELMPSEGNLFEEYTFFSISVDHLQMAFLSNPSVTQNIPKTVLYILCHNLGNAMYEFEEDPLLDFDLKKKLKGMSGNIAVKGVLANQRETINGMRSLGTIEQRIGTKFNATVSVKARITKRLTDEDIDIISEMATTDEGFSSFTFSDELDSDKEVVDVIHRQAYLTKKITLSKEEQREPDAIWGKLCTAFVMR